MIENCPACHADLIHKRNKFRLYSRVIGIQTNDYDGILLWQCPDCGHRWHRWPEGTHWHRLAEPHVTAGWT